MTASFGPLRPGQFVFEDARLLLVEVGVSGAATANLLPEPLAVAGPPTATLFFADYPKTTFGSAYKEAGILLHAGDAEGPLVHCPWIVVDDDTALILGRELFGFPKKMADVDFRVEGDTATGVVHRKGRELMRIEAELAGIEAEPPPVFNRRAVNVLGSLVTGMKLVDASTEERITQSRRGRAKVLVRSSRRDPLADLEPAPDGPARYVELDYGAGSVVPRVVGDVDPGWALRHFFARAL